MFHLGTHGATRPCRHEFHVVSRVNRVHFHAGTSFMSGLHVKGLLDIFITGTLRSFSVAAVVAKVQLQRSHAAALEKLPSVPIIKTSKR